MSLLLLVLAAVATAGGWLLWQRGRGKTRQIALMSVIIAVFCVFASACSASATPQNTTKTKVVKIGTARKARAVAVSSKLDEQFDELTSESESLDSASSKYEAESASKAAESRSKAAAASSKAVAASKAAASSRAAVASSQAAATSRATASSRAAASSRAHATTNHSAPVNHGDMTTGGQGKIIGNVNSKIYHVPGQASYRMNSANAVYFASEAAAQAAGYRRSKR